jgi:galactitol-specific phosphotransferase system IIC component
MEPAAPAVAPVIPPVIVPIVQLKLAGALDVRLILVLVLLQIDVVAGLVTTGVGFTVTVIVYGAPAQLPVVEVGVTIYSTVPDAELLGFVSV